MCCLINEKELPDLKKTKNKHILLKQFVIQIMNQTFHIDNLYKIQIIDAAVELVVLTNAIFLSFIKSLSKDDIIVIQSGNIASVNTQALCSSNIGSLVPSNIFTKNKSFCQKMLAIFRVFARRIFASKSETSVDMHSVCQIWQNGFSQKSRLSSCDDYSTFLKLSLINIF